MVQRQIETYTVDPTGNAVPDGNDPDQERSYDEFRASVQGSESEIKAWVWKVPETKDGEIAARGKLEFLFSEPIDKYTMDDILKVVRDDWMVPGKDTKWHIRVHVMDSKGMRLNKLLVVRKAIDQNAQSTRQAQSQLSETLEAVQRMMAAQQERFDAALRAGHVAPQQAQPQMSFMDMLALMSKMQSDSMTGLAQLLTALRPAQAGSNDLLATVRTIREVKDLTDDLSPPRGGGGDGGPGLVDIVKAVSPFAPLLKTIVEQNRQALPAPVAPLVNPAPSAPAPVVSQVPKSPPDLKVVPTPEPTQEQKDMIGQLRQQLGELAQIAGEKPDPKAIVSMLLPSLPETFDDTIYGTLIADNWFEQLSALQPAIKPHREWFETLRAELLQSYKVKE